MANLSNKTVLNIGLAIIIICAASVGWLIALSVQGFLSEDSSTTFAVLMSALCLFNTWIIGKSVLNEAQQQARLDEWEKISQKNYRALTFERE